MKADDLEFRSSQSPVVRIFFFVFGLLPLLAPYELLLKPKWNTFFSPFFFLALVISIGAVGVTVFFLSAALLGLNKVVRFNAAQREVVYGFGAPLLKWRRKLVPFAQIVDLRVETQTWDSGPDTYDLSLDTVDGHSIRFGKFVTRDDAEKTRTAIRTILGTGMPVTDIFDVGATKESD